MRRFSVLMTALVAAWPTTASAAELTVVHEAPIPCAVVCPYWHGEVAGFDVCANPGPPGSYDDTMLMFTETDRRSVIGYSMEPTFDHDIFICTATEPSREVTGWACVCPPPECTGPYYTYGCREEGVILYEALKATNGSPDPRFLVRTFNWLDPDPRVTVNLSGPVALAE